MYYYLTHFLRIAIYITEFTKDKLILFPQCFLNVEATLKYREHICKIIFLGAQVKYQADLTLYRCNFINN